MMQSKNKKSLAITGIASLSLILSACASNPQKYNNPDDPLEGYNRAVYGFNKGVDKIVIKPVAYTYKTLLPRPVQSGVGNFFSNLGEVTTVANDLLQFKIRYMTHDLARFTINSTIGILGLFDVASVMGLDKRKEDFGQTLYTWGYKKSAYFVLPFLGPSTFRDTIGLTADYVALSVWPWIEPKRNRYLLLGLNLIDTRAELLSKETILNTIAVDEYSLVRDAYLQNRYYLSTDGKLEDLNDADIYNDLEEYPEDSTDTPTS